MSATGEGLRIVIVMVSLLVTPPVSVTLNVIICLPTARLLKAGGAVPYPNNPSMLDSHFRLLAGTVGIIGLPL